MTTKQQTDKESRILRAAVKVFAQHGFHGSSIAEVAREAGVATGTIYLYFKRKEDLLTELFNRTLQAYLEENRPILQMEEPGLPRFAKLVELQLRFFDRDHDLARVIQIHLRMVDPLIVQEIRPTMREFFNLTEDILREGVDSGAFRADLDLKMARRLFFGGMDEVVTHWVYADPRLSLMAMHQQLTRSFLGAFKA